MADSDEPKAERRAPPRVKNRACGIVQQRRTQNVDSHGLQLLARRLEQSLVHVNGLRSQIEDAVADVFPPVWQEAAHPIGSTAAH